ncbi:metal ABC transporter permease [Modestobacter sp. I12A-02628]|uniref:Metal ABC transporter permease n=1 Tax=Goekera deserti TaxID=2497753 RepID=A0A7K3WDI8_9ACTN|nr:metal ABC transporter permease [Goekera deserti]MPQ97158.1 metal ABC transporter permease [Goekera deserti]NDI46524.1 metal ABC transporter permease [Goekera deserti]NEL54542.1 metal ABC transporter permease [Goekera deserti]
MSGLFDFTDYGALLGLVQNSLIAAALLGVVGGLIGVFVQMRDMQFAVHGISELSFAGAAAALLLGVNVALGSVLGSLLAGALIGLLGVRARDRNSLIGVLMPFGLGLGVLFLALYEGRAANKFGLLTGQIVSVDTVQLGWLVSVSVVVLVGLAVVWRPLTFVSADPEVAAARGVPVGVLSVVFTVLLALAVSLAVQVVGALLVLSLLVTPAAAALRVTASPVLAPLLSAGFALTASVGGILLALGGSIPISPFVTTISFAIYLVCRVVAWRRTRRGWGGRRPAGAETARPVPAAVP